MTEKAIPVDSQRDGGASLLLTLKRALGKSMETMHFGEAVGTGARWAHPYLYNSDDRFERRLGNADYVATKVAAVAGGFTHVVFVHISMQFGLPSVPMPSDVSIWTFPMFLTPSYERSGEMVPNGYTKAERAALQCSDRILTPSHLEKQQLISFYEVAEERIRVIPRGIDLAEFRPRQRYTTDHPVICSIGSIKPQKNTLGLLRTFAAVQQEIPAARLRLIGPEQSACYAGQVRSEIERLRISEAVERVGYVPRNRLAATLEDAHLHLSCSVCETFGRSIFESLALGIPNVALRSDNAAAEYLGSYPCARFVASEAEAAQAVLQQLQRLNNLSRLAASLATLFDDRLLARLLRAELQQSDAIVISDFDGTLFHKDDSKRTEEAAKAFRSYPCRVVCSARSPADLLAQAREYDLRPDWIIGFSGAVITDSTGRVIRSRGFDAHTLSHLRELHPTGRLIEYSESVVQLALPQPPDVPMIAARCEVYQGDAYLSPWGNSKLAAAQWLLGYLGWEGRVCAFGDGPNDRDILTFFDGKTIKGKEVIDEHSKH